MSFAALIPFMLLFLLFAGFRTSLLHASFVALLSGTLLTGTLFHSRSDVWAVATRNTLVLTVEIGLILIGAFFFLEMSRRSGMIDSLARLVRSVAPQRVVQGVLVSFPLTLMVEGSSGFGTPTLVIAPILMALKFDLRLCALLPFLTCVVGIPYGALGTPTRLGFPDAAPAAAIFRELVPLMFLAPLLAARFISPVWNLRESLWILSLSGVYVLTGLPISNAGPELSALGPAFFTFLYGLVSARFLFGEKREAPFEWRGLILYGALLACMFLGKEWFQERRFDGSGIRIFNPGWIFLLFGCALIPRVKKTHSLRMILLDTTLRARRTLFVFFCMTFLVQQLRANGSLELLMAALPEELLGGGAPVLGFLGSVFVGTSTLANLLLSKIVVPESYAALAAGSAMGVPLAFQSIVAVRSVLHEGVTEREILMRMAPIGVGFLLIVLI
jgi:L-lactate permease